MAADELTTQILIQIRDEIRGTNQRVDRMEHSLGQRIDGVEHSLGQRIDVLGDRIDILTTRVDQVGNVFGQRIDVLGERIDILTTRVDQVGDRTMTLSHRMDALADRQREDSIRLATEVHEVANLLRTVIDRVVVRRELDDRVANCEREIVAIKARIS